jgi:hypothetical protein
VHALQEIGLELRSSRGFHSRGVVTLIGWQHRVRTNRAMIKYLKLNLQASQGDVRDCTLRLKVEQ